MNVFTRSDVYLKWLVEINRPRCWKRFPYAGEVRFPG